MTESNEKYLDDCTTIEPLALEEEFIRTPKDLAYWNEQYAAAYLDWKKKKIARDQLWKLLYRDLGDTVEPRPGSRGVTVSDIEAAVTVDASYLAGCTAEVVAEANKIRLHGIMEVLRTKRDMLISLGAHMRHTMQQDLVLRTPDYIQQQELASRQ